ncbi:MAG: hypothetical protein ABJO88_15975 [Parasphingorhabdus sp.]
MPGNGTLRQRRYRQKSVNNDLFVARRLGQQVRSVIFVPSRNHADALGKIHEVGIQTNSIDRLCTGLE